MRHYATSWKVVGSIPGEVKDFSIDLFHPATLLSLGLTQSLKEMSAGNLSGVKNDLTTICEMVV
jgi:hypothetical protein